MMLQRDQKSGAILNTDVAALNKYKQDRAQFAKVANLQRELASVKETLARVCERVENLEKK